MENAKKEILSVVKGLLIGVSVCLGCILAFALVLKFVTLSPFWVGTVDQIIKLAAVVLACLFSVRGERGLLKGAITGLSVVAVTYLLFGLISGGLTFGLNTLYECAFGLIAGGLSGILSVNLKR